jgi:alkylhydroperoxidase family enzyme
MDVTAFFAREAKIDDARIAAIRGAEAGEPFDEAERLVLRFADGMSATPAHVDGGVFSALRAKFGDEAMVELAAAVATENFSARFNVAFEIESQGLNRVAVPKNR